MSTNDPTNERNLPTDSELRQLAEAYVERRLEEGVPGIDPARVVARLHRIKVEHWERGEIVRFGLAHEGKRTVITTTDTDIDQDIERDDLDCPGMWPW